MDDLEAKVKESIDMIRPALQNDGGDIEFVRMKDKYVYVKLQGECAGCAMAMMTLMSGVERMLKTNVDPDIQVFNLPFTEEDANN